MRNLKMLACLILALAMSMTLLPAGFVGATEDLPQLLVQTETEDVSESIYNKNFDETGFFKGVKAVDYIVMFKYKGLSIPSEVHWISDEVIQNEIDYIIASFPAINKVTDRAVQSGDRVNIDFVGSIDGVEFSGGNTNGMGTEVIAGSADYVDNFLDQIIGHMPGETIDVKVTFPEDYAAEELSGKAAVFVTTINYIVEEGDILLTDSFVAENLNEYYGWKTVEEMKAGIRADMRKYGLYQYVIDYLKNKVTIKSVPEQMIDYQIESMLDYFQGYADYYGMELEELLLGEGFSNVSELIEAQNEYILENAGNMLVLLAVAEDAGLTVSDRDITDYFIENGMSSDYLEIVEEYGMPFIKHNILCQKAIDFVINNSVMAVCVVLDGRLLTFDVPAQIVNDRALVPLRAIFEELGAEVSWDNGTKTVTATKDGTEISLTIGSTSPTVNGKVVTIDQPGIIVNGRALVPIRFIAEALGVSVAWEGSTRTVKISS